MARSVSGASAGTRIPPAAHGWRSRTSRWASRSRVVHSPHSVGRSGPAFSNASQIAARSARARFISALGDERARRDLGAVVEARDLEVVEHVGHLALQLAQALDRELADLDV